MLTAQSLKTKYVVSRSARAGPSRCRQGELLPFRLFKSHGTSPGNWGHVFTSAGRTWSEHRIRAAPSVGHSKTCVDDGESDSNQTPRDSNPQPLDNERISPARVRRSPTRYPLRQAPSVHAMSCMLDKSNIFKVSFAFLPVSCPSLHLCYKSWRESARANALENLAGMTEGYVCTQVENMEEARFISLGCDCRPCDKAVNSDTLVLPCRHVRANRAVLATHLSL